MPIGLLGNARKAALKALVSQYDQQQLISLRSKLKLQQHIDRSLDEDRLTCKEIKELVAAQNNLDRAIAEQFGLPHGSTKDIAKIKEAMARVSRMERQAKNRQSPSDMFAQYLGGKS